MSTDEDELEVGVILPSDDNETTTQTSDIYDNDSNDPINTQKLFVLGYVHNGRHNTTLQTIINDLLSQYYVSWNSPNWKDESGQITRSRHLLSNADALIFYITDATLKDVNCLLTLQYAWQLSLPITMLRPPQTSLVISNRDAHRERQPIRILGKTGIMKSDNGEPWQLITDIDYDSVDYNLLQDVLQEGYRISTIYDALDHPKSISRLHRKLATLFLSLPISTPIGAQHPHFYLSPSNSGGTLFSASRNASEPRRLKSKSITRRKTRNGRNKHDIDKDNNQMMMKLNLSQSTGNLMRITPYPVGGTNDYEEEVDNDELPTSRRESQRLKSPPPPDLAPSSDNQSNQSDTSKAPTLQLPKPSNILDSDVEIDIADFKLPPLTPITPGCNSLFTSGRNSEKQCSMTSRTSSLDRRMSFSCIEDLSNYQKTQYLVFPLRDSQKKPYLIRFPEDMAEEEEKHGGSVWGSDTSLEEEIKLAATINAGIMVDYTDDSPIVTPAPLLGDLS